MSLLFDDAGGRFGGIFGDDNDYDDMIVGSQMDEEPTEGPTDVPEPGALALFGLALLSPRRAGYQAPPAASYHEVDERRGIVRA